MFNLDLFSGFIQHEIKCVDYFRFKELKGWFYQTLKDKEISFFSGMVGIVSMTTEATIAMTITETMMMVATTRETEATIMMMVVATETVAEEEGDTG